jgi:hypothetical protein
VDELRALLHRVVTEVTRGEHPAADSVLGFDDDHVETGARAVASRGHTGHPSPDDDDVLHQGGMVPSPPACASRARPSW